MRNWKDYVRRIIDMIYLLLVGGMFLTVVMLRISTNPYYFHSDWLGSFTLLVLGLAFIFALWLGIDRISRQKHQLGLKRSVTIASLLLFVTELFLTFCTAFESQGWDAKLVFHDAGLLVFPDAPEVTEWSTNLIYYFRYPNNRAIFLILVMTLKVCKTLGVHSLGVAYLACVVIQCVLFTVAGAMLLEICYKETKSSRVAWFAWCIYFVLVGISPWLLIVYTDSLGIIFPILTLWIYLKTKDRSWLRRWGLLSLVGGIGYFVKPTVAISLIALIIVEAFGLLERVCDKKIALCRAVVRSAIVVVMMLICFKGLATVRDKAFETVTETSINHEEEINFLHYMCLGLNEESEGTFNNEDFDRSTDVNTVAERNALNIAEIKSRLKEMFPKRLVIQYVKKTKTNYSDGLFGYGISDPGFVGENYSEELNHSVLASEIRDVYQPEGSKYMVLLNAGKAIWLGVLALALANGLRFRGSTGNVTRIVKISIIGIIIFTAMFEASPRYTFIYAPIYILSGAFATQAILDKIKLLKRNSEEA